MKTSCLIASHYRIDVAAAVPGPAVGTGLPGLAFAALGMLWLGRNRQGRWMPWQA